MLFKNLGITLLLLLQSVIVVAEDYADDDYYDSIKVCSDADIDVNGISLLCDSPGTFYYGSGKYRSNPYCQTGDKAKLTVTFEVTGDISEVDPLLTLTAKGDGETVTIYKNARLCNLGTLSSTDGSSCGSYGNFSISTQFYWEKQNDDDSSQQLFSPYVTVGFHTENDPDKYDLGGANTDLCEGNSVITTSDVGNQGISALASVLWSLLILVGTIGILGMFAWYLWKRPFSQQNIPPASLREASMYRSGDQFSRYYGDSSNVHDDDRKITLIRSNRSLVDF